MKMKLAEVSKAVGAINKINNNEKDIDVTNVSFDTRNLKPGSLFVPLKTSNRDGHDYISDAIKKGAVATLWSEDNLKNAPKDFPMLLVSNPLKSLQQLSKYYLKKINPKVIGITGSNGKTTTKDMVAAILSSRFNVSKTQGNYNNELGLPLTILSMKPNTEVLVAEMGMDRPGQIQLLSKLINPDISIITMIGEAHLEYFHTRDKIADAKLEILSGMPEDGTLIYNGDDRLLKDKLKNNYIGKKIDTKTFGRQGTNDLYPTSIEATAYNTKFSVNDWKDFSFLISLMGEYNVNNALAALSVGKILGVNAEQMRNSLEEMKFTPNRTQWVVGKNDYDILSDVYNSNPTAVKAVLKSFENTPTKGKRIVVLGDMLELGKDSKKLHQSLASLFNPDKINSIYLIGNDMKSLKDKLASKYPKSQLHYYKPTDKKALSLDLQKNIHNGDKVLLKASHGIHLEELLEDLKK